MSRTLVIGYGNLHRRDDGVAYHVVNALRERLGLDALSGNDTGLEELGAEIDSVFLTQLLPELIDTLVDYGRVVFVDAHVRPDLPDLHYEAVIPSYTPSAFTHHVTPAMLLSLLRAIHHHQLEGHLVSIRGQEFDFGCDLSSDVQDLVRPAVDRILKLAR